MTLHDGEFGDLENNNVFSTVSELSRRCLFMKHNEKLNSLQKNANSALRAEIIIQKKNGIPSVESACLGHIEALGMIKYSIITTMKILSVYQNTRAGRCIIHLPVLRWPSQLLMKQSSNCPRCIS